jgi:HindVP restriction endonuclease
MCAEAVTGGAPSLYGITDSNRTGKHLWGKNEFNSTFPTALACYMQDKGVRAVYLSLRADLRVEATEIAISDLFNSDRPNNEIRFDFETRHEPYQHCAFDDIGGTDLIMRN